MSPNPTGALTAQFSRFAIDQDLSPNDWEMAAAEFDVIERASNIDRFFRSWHFGDDDCQANTARFLREVAEEDGQEVALGVMQRIFTMADVDEDAVFQKYPALERLDELDSVGKPLTSVHFDLFLDIENIPGTFYPGLVDDINQCYEIGVYDATLVLTRKLLENLLIDVLRKQYGTDRIELYYQPENTRFRNFNTLIDNFEENLNDFKHLSGALNDKFISELDSFRQNANAEAHSIETNISEEDMKEYQEQARHAAKVLFRVYQNN